MSGSPTLKLVIAKYFVMVEWKVTVIALDRLTPEIRTRWKKYTLEELLGQNIYITGRRRDEPVDLDLSERQLHRPAASYLDNLAQWISSTALIWTAARFASVLSRALVEIRTSVVARRATRCLGTRRRLPDIATADQVGGGLVAESAFGKSLIAMHRRCVLTLVGPSCRGANVAHQCGTAARIDRAHACGNIGDLKRYQRAGRSRTLHGLVEPSGIEPLTS